ncbi:MAG TPA: TSUP family transporter [Chloroflexota bacterium]|nr:TSUP family transporter [Chloroflexota bacterium]
MVSPGTAAALFGVAVIGGVINSIAGGGTFVVFPTLLLSGVPAIQANATNTVALWPGVVFSLFAVRRQAMKARFKAMLAVTSLIGGGIGALLLLKTPPALFELTVPFLLLAATLMFTLNPVVARRLSNRRGGAPRIGRGRVAATVVTVFLIAIYGGYFGGGIGILILAALSLLGLTDFHDMNAFRLILSCSANAVAVVVFAVAGAVAWPQASVMLVGAILGGYGGASFAKRIRAIVLRRFVMVLGFTMSGYFFYRQFA